MLPNQIQAVRKMRVAIQTALSSLKALNAVSAEANPALERVQRAVENDIARVQTLQIEADELFGQDWPPPAHSQISRWARTALLSLAGPVDNSDIEAAKARMRMIIDMIENRPPAPTPEQIQVAYETPLPSEVIIRFLKEHDSEWFVDDDGEIIVLEHLHSFITNIGAPPTPDTGARQYMTEIHRVRTLEEARHVLGY